MTIRRSAKSPTAAVLAGLLAGGAATAAPEPSAPAAAKAGIDMAGIDKSVAPGNDFFAYANGTWLKNTPIPPDRSSYGAGVMLVELTSKRTADLIKEVAAGKAAAGSEERKIADAFASYMDEAALEAKGAAPLKKHLDAIAAIGDRKALAEALGRTLRADVDVLNATNMETDNLFGLWVAQDLSNPSRYLPFLLQGGLTMPSKEYYLDATDKMNDVRSKYKAHVAAVLKLAGITGAEAKAERVFELEKKIAETHVGRADSSDVNKGNNHWSLADFSSKAPGLDWKAYFTAAGLGSQNEFVAWHPPAFTGISALVASQPLDAWKDYLTFHLIERSSGLLSKAFVDERFAFHGQVLSGTPQLQDRWKRGVDFTNGVLGDAVGQIYIKRYFPPASKANAEAMVKNILAAFGTRIDKLDWMAPATKSKAKAKLATLKVGIGYADKFKDYSTLEIARGDLFGNAERAEIYELKRNLAKLGKPVDRTEWVMTPQTVNAVNLPVMNTLNFPAAILQPPFFDANRPAAMNYGAIGSVIGHEICHSFDDQGALFDDTGKLQNWWTKADFEHFEASSDKLVKQYDAYKPLPDLNVRGKQTLSENIADVAGLSAAYDGWKLSLGGKPAPAVEGLTGDQQFFVSFAQSWRQKRREASLRRQVLTDGHSPSEFRADTVRNLDPWYGAFNVKAGEGLYLAPADRVKIW